MLIALDTNILVYAEGVNGQARAEQALAIIDAHAEDGLVIPAQAFGELFMVLTRKARWPAERARAAVLAWRDTADVAETTDTVLLEALDIATMHGFALRDAVILAAAAQAGCRILLSEDMHAGFIWRGVEIQNPFRT